MTKRLVWARCIGTGLVVAGMMVSTAACGGATITMSPSPDPVPDAPGASGSTGAAFRLTSSAFDDGGEIPGRHGCSGEDVSPRLDWSGAPTGAVEFVLVVDDPDARGFLHWLLTGIPAAPEGSLDEGRGDPAAHPDGQGANDFGRTGWGGPCPPRRHTYVFTLYALSAPLDVGQQPGIDAVRAAMEGRIVGEARLIGTYEKGS